MILHDFLPGQVEFPQKIVFQDGKTKRDWVDLKKRYRTFTDSRNT